MGRCLWVGIFPSVAAADTVDRLLKRVQFVIVDELLKGRRRQRSSVASLQSPAQHPFVSTIFKDED